MSEQLKYVSVLFPVLGVGLFSAGISYRRRLKERAVGCERTMGTVVDNVAGLAGGFDTSPVYYPVVEYFVGGSRFTLTGAVGYGQRKKTGEKLAVMFSPETPSRALIVENYYLLANLLLAIGGTFILFGSLLAYELIF